MRRTIVDVAALSALAAAAAVVLAGCGAEKADARGDGRTRTGATGGPGSVSAQPLCPSDRPRYGAEPSDEPAATGTGRPSGTPLPLPGGEGPVKDGVRITGLFAGARDHRGDCDLPSSLSAEFEVTNRGTAPATYTITFRLPSGSGGPIDTIEKTVPSVRPGQTLEGTVPVGHLPADLKNVTRVEVAKVRSVPDDEAPSASGPCPASGIRLYADDGDAAMGLRVVGLHLENCGTGVYRLNGYPQLQIQDEDHGRVESVRIVHGDEIASGTGADGPPEPVALQPGERAYAGLVWRNTIEGGTPVNAPYVRVWAKPGARPVTVTPELDLGTTGRLGVDPWKKDTASSSPGARPSTTPSTS
ncbi:DUF4232 domain-containing protein [Streptomyces sp. NPDC001796]|uniref:DUF4232 domain-containing protein n=1 Tax=Streptomyces sp. NPDC001796 TaxID=3364609 RepID=UPI0036762270